MPSPLDIFSVFSPLRNLEHVEKEGNGALELLRAYHLPHAFDCLNRPKDTDAVSYAIFCSAQLGLHVQVDPFRKEEFQTKVGHWSLANLTPSKLSHPRKETTERTFQTLQWKHRETVKS